MHSAAAVASARRLFDGSRRVHSRGAGGGGGSRGGAAGERREQLVGGKEAGGPGGEAEALEDDGAQARPEPASQLARQAGARRGVRGEKRERG